MLTKRVPGKVFTPACAVHGLLTRGLVMTQLLLGMRRQVCRDAHLGLRNIRALN